MNRLSTRKRAKILSLLVEGMSIRSVGRLLDVSQNTVAKLLLAAGEACLDHHDKHVRNLEKLQDRMRRSLELRLRETQERR